MGASIPTNFQLHAHQWMSEFSSSGSGSLYAVEYGFCPSPLTLYGQGDKLAIGSEGSLQHLLRKGQSLLPLDHHCTHLLVVLLRSHFLIDLPP